MVDANGPPGGTGVQDESSDAKEKAQEVAGQARDVIREQIDQRSSQAGERMSGAAGDLRSVGEELRNKGKDAPAKLADRAAERAERVGSYLSESDGDRLLSDVEDFGRRQPLAILAGGLVVGMAAARFLKASSRSRYQSRIQAEGSTRELGTTAPPASARPVEAGTPAGRREAPAVPADPVVSR